jgi:hypothetical protein
MKRDTRHARRRANLATSSGTDPSRFGARCLALSRPPHGVIHNCRKFSAAKAKKEAPLTSVNDSVSERSAIGLRVKKTRRTKSLPRRATASCLTIDERQRLASLSI